MDEARDGIPRLAIRHFFLWAASTAFCMTGVRYSYLNAVRLNSSSVPRASEDPWNAVALWVFVVASAVVGGAAIAGAVVTIRVHLRRTREAPWQPGHLLLIILGAGTVARGIGDFAAACHSSVPLVSQLGTVAYGLVLYVVTPLYFGFLAWKWTERSWRAYFALEALTALVFVTVIFLVPITGIASLGIQAAIPATMILALAALVFSDWLLQKKRDWLHRVGVTVAIGLNVIPVLWALWHMSYWLVAKQALGGTPPAA